MTRADLICVTALFVVLASILCGNGQIHWPNLICHTANSSALQGRAFRYNRMGWRSCLERYVKYKGNCAHICVLFNDQIILRNVSHGPNIFDVDAFVKFFAAELGYSLKGPDGPEKKLMSNVRAEMEICKSKHPEYVGIKNLMNSPCDPWENFLKCFDAAIGCGPWNMTKPSA